MATINPWLGDLLLVLLITVVLVLSSVTYKGIEERGRQLGRRLMKREPRTSDAGREVHATARTQASETY